MPSNFDSFARNLQRMAEATQNSKSHGNDRLRGAIKLHTNHTTLSLTVARYGDPVPITEMRNRRATGLMKQRNVDTSKADRYLEAQKALEKEISGLEDIMVQLQEKRNAIETADIRAKDKCASVREEMIEVKKIEDKIKKSKTLISDCTREIRSSEQRVTTFKEKSISLRKMLW